MRSTPQYRTAFLVDTSDPGPSGVQWDFGALADSVGAADQGAADQGAADQGAADRDALSLRRFGGVCGEPGNTEEIVGSAIGNGKRISAAAHALAPAGRATLNSGLLAAIDDFSGRYPFRGSKRNRIVVVTTQGTDGCGGDPAAMNAKVRDRMDALGLQLEFRFVGYRVPPAQQEALTRLLGHPQHRTAVHAERRRTERGAREARGPHAARDEAGRGALPGGLRHRLLADRYAPGRNTRAPAAHLLPDVTESACREADTGGTANIPTGVPGLYLGTERESGRTDVKGMLRLLRFGGEQPATSSLVCLLPKEQADICAASLVYFFLQQATGTDISTADRDRVTAAIEAYVKSLP